MLCSDDKSTLPPDSILNLSESFPPNELMPVRPERSTTPPLDADTVCVLPAPPVPKVRLLRDDKSRTEPESLAEKIVSVTFRLIT